MKSKHFLINGTVFLVSSIFYLLILLFVLKSIEIALCANVNNLEFKRKPSIWIEDPIIGFKNKPNYNHKGFANLRGITNDFGFRSRKSIPIEKRPNVIRILGIGDSVMWGNQLNEEDSFLHVLEQLAQRKKGQRVETINGGVIGYSTYQEKLFLERYASLYRPDIVLVNFCSNDWLPTEDPFLNIKDIYIQYLQGIVNNQDYQITKYERRIINELTRAMKTNKVWNAFQIMNANIEKRGVLKKVLIEWPILQMNKLAKDNEIRLIFIFMTPEMGEIRKFLIENSIEYVDVSNALLENKPEQEDRKETGSKSIEVITKGQNHPHSEMFLNNQLVKSLNPLLSIRNIKKVIAFKVRHHQKTFIDKFGHPSIKGSKIIAKYLYEYLFNTKVPLEQ